MLWCVSKHCRWLSANPILTFHSSRIRSIIIDWITNCEKLICFGMHDARSLVISFTINIRVDRSKNLALNSRPTLTGSVSYLKGRANGMPISTVLAKVDFDQSSNTHTMAHSNKWINRELVKFVTLFPLLLTLRFAGISCPASNPNLQSTTSAFWFHLIRGGESEMRMIIWALLISNVNCPLIDLRLSARR